MQQVPTAAITAKPDHGEGGLTTREAQERLAKVDPNEQTPARRAGGLDPDSAPLYEPVGHHAADCQHRLSLRGGNRQRLDHCVDGGGQHRHQLRADVAFATRR